MTYAITQMNLKIIILSERDEAWRTIETIVSLISNARKAKTKTEIKWAVARGWGWGKVTAKGHKETIWNNRTVSYLDDCGGYTTIYICQNSL